jgi:filamentous hemagglutinin family protein
MTLTRGRLSRSAILLCSTALQAGLFAMPALAQPPAVQPQGGQVTAGAASIAQSAVNTTVTQASQRAAIDWTSYNIGRGQSVTYRQPGASAVILNRVTGPDPSRIAGSIQANGVVVLTNGNGVVFSKGAQVNAQGLVVSAAGITNQNFMAGRMVFDKAPNPNAAIRNAGTLTMAQAGMVALVGPRVANAGVINARLGHVVLAGAQTHVLDMYGDGLVSVDVTRQVTRAPVGKHGRVATALVTNTGTIVADGGTVTLSAAAADGVVQTLVDAGGTIRADTVGGQGGVIAVSGVGGSITIAGSLLARGRAPGTTGGQIALNATGTVRIGPHARVDASGRAGGGVIAVGTTLARAVGGPGVAAPMATRVVVAKGARIRASATRSGSGGKITVLSSGQTVMRGHIAASGGKHGGDGGQVEISGATVRLGGAVTVAAPAGQMGSILLDPEDLTITANPGSNDIAPGATPPNVAYSDNGTATDSTVTPAQLAALTGDIQLQAARNLIVASSFAGTGSITLQAGNNLTVNAGVTISAPTAITLAAAVFFGANATPVPGYSAAGAIAMDGSLQTPSGAVTLSSGTGGVDLGGNIVSNTTQINSTGALTQSAGVLNTGALAFNVTSASLTQANQIASTGVATATAGNITINEAPGQTLSVAGRMSVSNGQTISLATDGLGFVGFSQLRGGAGALSAPGGLVAVAPVTPGLPVALLGTEVASGGTLSLNAAALAVITAATLQLGSSAAGPITVGPAGDAIANVDTLALLSGGAVTQGGSLSIGTLSAGTLTGSAASFDLGNGANGIGTLGAMTSQGALTIASGQALTVDGPVSGVAVALSGLSLALAGNVSGGSVDLSSTGQGGLTQSAGTITAGTLTGTDQSAQLNDQNLVSALGDFTVQNGFALTNATSLDVIGTVQTSGGSLTLTQSGVLGLAAGGTLSGAGVPVALDVTGGAITEAQGAAILAASLSGTADSASLTSRTNQVAALGPFATAAGGFALTNAVPLDIVGAVSVPNGQTIGLTLDQFNFFGDNAGALLAPGGVIAIAPLTTGRPIEVVNSGTATPGDLSIDTTLLGIMQTATLQLGSAAAGPINIGNVGDAIDLTGIAGTLDLLSGGAITEGGSLTVGTLMGTADSAALGGGNLVGTLAAFTTQTGFSLTNAQALTVAGPVSDQTSVGLTVTGDLTLEGTIGAPTVNLGATGAITQPGGAIIATTLTGNAGSATLISPANSIVDLGAFSAAGALELTDARSLTVTDLVTPGSLTLTVAGDLGIAGPIFTGPVSLDVTGAVTDTGSGELVATTLTGRAASVVLGQGVGLETLSDFATTGGFLLSDGQNLAVTGTVTDPGSITLISQGPMLLSGVITAPDVSLFTTPYQYQSEGPQAPPDLTQTAGSVNASATLLLSSSGVIAQTGGVMVAGELRGMSAGTTALASTANNVASLGDFTSVGGFILVDGAPLTVTGPVQDSASIGLSVAGSLRLAGILNASSVDLGATGGIVQSSGTIGATTLSGSAATALLSGLNNVGTLATFSTTGDLSLNDIAPLTVAGPVVAGGLMLADSGAVQFTGDVTAGRVLVSAAGTIGQTGGTLSTAFLGGSAVGGASFGPDAPGPVANVGTLGNFSVSGGNFALADGQALTLAGALSSNLLTISAPGQILLQGGAINIASQPAGAAPASTIVVTSNGNSPGTLAQGGTTTVTLQGGTGALQLLAPGGITLNNLAGTSVRLVLTSDGAITGNLAVAGLTVQGSAGSADLFGTVAGVAGPPAAALAAITPAINAAYLLNNCVIAAASCGTVLQNVITQQSTTTQPAPSIFNVEAYPSTLLPSRFPLLVIPNLLPLPPLTFPVNLADPDIALPNISSQDY